MRRLVAATMIAVPAFFRHRGTQLAAAISYRVLFAIVPFLALALSLVAAFLSDDTERKIKAWIAGLAEGDGQLEASLARMLESTAATASLAGIVALVGLLWTSSGMASSVRQALAVVWEVQDRPPYLRGKLVDLALVFLGVALVLAAFVSNVLMQFVTAYGTELAEWLGLERLDVSALGAIGQSIAAFALIVVALLVLYRLAPNGPSIRELLPGAIVGALAAQLSIIGFSVYIGLLSGYDIYGALGGLFGFLFLVYLVASCVVVGAEVVAAWPVAARRAPPPPGPPVSLRQRLIDAGRGLVWRRPDR